MKANYTKPLLAVEMFCLAQTTARDCADIIPKDQLNFGEPGKCVWDLGGGMTVFVTGTCVLDGEMMGDIGCYNSPSEGNYVFRS